MALENSPLRDRIQEAIRNSKNKGQPAGVIRPPQQGDKPVKRPPYSKDSRQQESFQTRPPIQPRSPEFKEGPTINSHVYNKDKSMLDTGPKEFNTNNQPDAFSGSSQTSARYEQSSEPKKKGRTFDEIREENRRHGQYPQSEYPTNPPGNSKGAKRKRYNKFGDEIED